MVIPNLFCKSKPKIHRVLRSVIRNVASGTSQPADRIFAFTAPNIAIGFLLLSTNCAGKFNFSTGVNCIFPDESKICFATVQLRNEIGLPVSTVIFII